MKSYPILRSGFVALSPTGFKHPTPVSVSIAADILNKRRMQPDSNYFYHEGIEDLYLQTVDGAQTNILKNSEFQERILVSAKEAFATSNVWEWILIQFRHGGISGLHAAFLIETLNYIAGTAERKTNIQQWVRLLEAGSDISMIVTENSSSFLTLSELQKRNMIPRTLEDLVLKWLKQDGGFYDFMMSLKVIFGNRRILIKSS